MPELTPIGGRCARDLADQGLQALQRCGAPVRRAGLSVRPRKLRDWEITGSVHRQYQVPLLSPALAAWLGTAGELLLPLSWSGAGAAAALGLSVVNGGRHQPGRDRTGAAAALGVLLAGLAIYGPGRWTLERRAWPWLLQRMGQKAGLTS
jgi:putative oxidoreductase